MIPWFDDSGLVAIDERAWSRYAAATAADPARPSTRPSVSGLAVIPIQGPITKHATFMSALFGGTTIDTLRAQVAEARADRSVRGVLLLVDSPGGGVYGVDETAAAIADLAKSKPVVAFTSTMAASAAYWLMSGASRIVAAPSAEVGSIGVFAVHFDQSKALELAGITPTLVKAGTHKAEANPFHPLSDEDRAAMQVRIDQYYALFTRRVARGRGVSVESVRSGFGEGRVVLASDALQAGMVTDIGDWADALALAGDGMATRTVAASDDALRYRVALEAVAR